MIRKRTRAAIIAALKENPNATQVARQFDNVCCYDSIRIIAQKAGIELSAGKAARGRSISPEKRAAIIAALEKNPHASKVARQVGEVSTTTVWNIAKAAGIELTAGQAAKGTVKLPAEKRAEIVAVLENDKGASSRRIARQVGGVSHETVRTIKRRSNQYIVPRGSSCDPS